MDDFIHCFLRVNNNHTALPHPLTLTEDVYLENHELFASGSGRQGQLGQGNNFDNKNIPVKLNLPPVLHASGGYAHTLALTGSFYKVSILYLLIYFNQFYKEQREIWSWGGNLCNQLGFGDSLTRLVPKKVESLSNIKLVTTSVFHSLAVDSENRLIGWGQNKFNQIGSFSNSVSTFVKQPREIPNEIKDEIVSVKCSLKHNLLLTKAGDVYAWGDNTLFQLGMETRVQSSLGSPKKIPNLPPIGAIFPSDDFSIAVSAGWQIFFFSKSLFQIQVIL
jgi:alpha-tubulin suppressor-like RCC1 family protein